MSLTFRIFIIVLALILGIYYCVAEEPKEDQEAQDSSQEEGLGIRGDEAR